MSDNNNSLEVIDQIPKSLEEIKQYAYVFAKSGMFPDIKSLSQGMVKIIAGRELGLTPFASVRGINIINSKPELSANVISALIKNSAKYDYKVLEWNDKGCEIEFFQEKESMGKASFTEEDATKARLIGKENWQKHPKSMYFARAMSMGARTFCPDVFMGAVYAEGELVMVEEKPVKPSVSASPSPAPVDDVKEIVQEEVQVSPPEETQVTPEENVENTNEPEAEEAVQEAESDDGAFDEALITEEFKKDVHAKMVELGIDGYAQTKILIRSTARAAMPNSALDWWKLNAVLDEAASDPALLKEIKSKPKKGE